MTEDRAARELVSSRIPYIWEKSLIESLNQVISLDDKVHGLPHILNVVDNVYVLQFEPEFSRHSIDEEVLIAGAYLHDIGYAFKGSFSNDTFEHIEYGIRMAQTILKNIEGFDPNKISHVLYLIHNHDNAKFTVPNYHLDSKPRITQEQVNKREQTDDPNLRIALSILKEADSREYTDLTGTERTFQYGQRHNFPLHPAGESPSPHHPLNLCTLSNLLLFPHLAWLNATTAKGKLAAARGYLAAENWVRQYCAEHDILYSSDQNMEEILWAKELHPELLSELTD